MSHPVKQTVTILGRNRWEAFCNLAADRAATPRSETICEEMRDIFPKHYAKCAEDDALEFIRGRVAAYPTYYELVDTDRDSTLAPSVAAQIIAGGDVDWDEVEGDWMADARYDGAVWHIEDTLKDLGYDEDALEEAPEGVDTVRYLLEEVNASNPVRDMARNTPALLAEQILAWGEDMDTLSIWDNTAAQRAGAAQIAAALAPLGLPLTARWRAARELLEHQTSDYRLWEGMTLGIIHAADVGDYFDLRTPLAALRHSGGTVMVGLIDHGNGSGHEVSLTLPAPVDLPVDTYPVRLESSLGRYGWDEIAGTYTAAYWQPALIPAPAPVAA